MGRYVVGLSVGVFVGCGAFPAFLCESDSQCVNAGVQGFCEIDDGACSFPDTDCPSGRRYGSLGGFVGAGLCVGDDDVASGGSGGESGDGASPGGGSSTTGSPGGSGGGPSPSSSTSGDTGADPGTTGQVSGGGDGSTGGGDGGSSGGVEGGGTGGGLTEVTVTFGEGPGTDFDRVTRDTYLDDRSQATNAGATAKLRVYGGSSSTILLRFNVEAIPSGVDVQSAQLALHTGDSASMSCMIDVFEIYESWYEGREDERPGVANWNIRQGQTPWTAAGAGVGSRSNTALATIAGASTGTQVVVDIPTDVIQDWVDDSDSNYGFALTTLNSCSGFFMSSESTNGSERPQLTVTYETAAVP